MAKIVRSSKNGHWMTTVRGKSRGAFANKPLGTLNQNASTFRSCGLRNAKSKILTYTKAEDKMPPVDPNSRGICYFNWSIARMLYYSNKRIKNDEWQLVIFSKRPLAAIFRSRRISLFKIQLILEKKKKKT